MQVTLRVPDDYPSLEADVDVQIPLHFIQGPIHNVNVLCGGFEEEFADDIFGKIHNLLDTYRIPTLNHGLFSAPTKLTRDNLHNPDTAYFYMIDIIPDEKGKWPHADPEFHREALEILKRLCEKAGQKVLPLRYMSTGDTVPYQGYFD